MVLPWPGIKVDGKLYQHNPGRMTKGLDPPGLNIWVPPPEKELKPAEVLAKGWKEYRKGSRGR